MIQATPSTAKEGGAIVKCSIANTSGTIPSSTKTPRIMESLLAVGNTKSSSKVVSGSSGSDVTSLVTSAGVSMTGGVVSGLAAAAGGSGGGIGAGKPKAFLTLMNSSSHTTPKRQPAKKSGSLRGSGGGSGSKGQGTKSKASPSSSSKKADVTPSRTSNRSIKRPRTYDEELDDLKALKLSKKAKGVPKVRTTTTTSYDSSVMLC